jgi:hypothetical protein
MGIDYYTCANCGDAFADCNDYFSCEHCYEHFCTDECGGKETEDNDDPDSDAEIMSCIFCRREVTHDYDMIQFLLDKLSLTYDQAMDLYNEVHPEKDEEED